MQPKTPLHLPSGPKNPPVKDGYDRIFEIEVESWCYGLRHFPGPHGTGLVHRMIHELAPVFKTALAHNLVFNIFEVARRINHAAKHLVEDKEAVFSVLAQLRNVFSLNETEQFILAQALDPVTRRYPDALTRLDKKWRAERNGRQETQQNRAAA
jgi:hypothetical protein